MMPGYRTETAPGSGRQERERHRLQRRPLAILLAIALLLASVPVAVWARPVALPQVQDDSAASDTSLPGQVIAQGIAPLPRGEVAWTVRSIDVPGGEGTPVESFPVGFVVADGATAALLDTQGEVVGILADGEAAFLPSGKSGTLASWKGDTASLYEVALISGRVATAGETPGTVVGNPFAAPAGDAFDVELARETLTRDEQAMIPVSRSGAPVLFLQTAGSVQVQAGDGQVVELAAGQFAMLLGEVSVLGASDEPAAFLVAAIGEATAAGNAAAEGTPEARAAREDRQRSRDGAAAGGDTPRAERAREKRPKRVRTGGGGRAGGGGGGQGGQTAPQAQGTGGDTGSAPISGGVDATAPEDVPAGTPEPEPITEATPPVDATVPADGTPTPDETTPPDDPALGEEPTVSEDEIPTDVTVTPETTAPAGETVDGEPSPAVDAPPAEDTLPVEEAPAVEAPTEAVPVEDAPPAEPIAEEQVAEPSPDA